MDEAQVQRLLGEASEMLRESLNRAIKELNLPPQIALSALARVAAGYTHQFQRTLDDPQLKDKVEETFIENFNVFLYEFDEHDIKQEMERLKKMETN